MEAFKAHFKRDLSLGSGRPGDPEHVAVLKRLNDAEAAREDASRELLEFARQAFTSGSAFAGRPEQPRPAAQDCDGAGGAE